MSSFVFSYLSLSGLFLCLLSLSLSVSLSPSVVVVVVDVSCVCVVVVVVRACGVLWHAEPPTACGRGAGTHGDVLILYTGAF